ncbi:MULTISPECIES: phosphopantetheine-binding protein [Cedecea]|uniref:Putative acyl carrier protein n=1 Tax=Cedecea davisae DSM 4568 TaxID=566551 RepID=S3J4Q1_9ENTR|nr:MULTISPECIES: phosphopantetheine-binding protein [Cedecea]EPF14987.1 putative acyl carrier protein [Cedecea davisae DSM 4568]QIX96601.1 acyl carrier protein [Cedecea sp. FDAARGOS_727]SUX38018.1 Meromycolate extension acyl carrier protein [Cedecea davisae]
MMTQYNIVSAVNEIVASTLNCSIHGVQPEKHLCYDLLADSLALLDISLALEDKFKIEYKEEFLAETEYVKDLYSIVGKALSTSQQLS